MNNMPQPISIMGILNTTPDSFSDGGSYTTVEKALQQAKTMIEAGASIIDIGGESTRPGSLPISCEEELQRTIPTIRTLRSESDVTISIDTTKAEVARQAVESGANIINDISALELDSAMIDVVKNCKAELVLMHMQGRPATMQDDPRYNNVVEEVYSYFAKKIEQLTREGVTAERLIIDPGIGFGKSLDHNIALLKNLHRLKSLGCRLLLGHSRKRFLGALTGRETADRDLATAVTAALVAKQGVDIVRVHNVTAHRDALAIAAALQ